MIQSLKRFILLTGCSFAMLSPAFGILLAENDFSGAPNQLGFTVSNPNGVNITTDFALRLTGPGGSQPVATITFDAVDL